MKRAFINYAKHGMVRDLVFVTLLVFVAISLVTAIAHPAEAAASAPVGVPLLGMAVINADNARAAARNFRAIFFNELRLAPNQWWRDLFTIVPSDNQEEVFNWMVGNPSMREWLGDRRIKSVSQASFKVTAKEWEATISVLRSQIQYDKLSQVRLYIQQMGQSFPQHYGDLASDLIVNAFTSLAYDNQFYFDTDHDAGDGTTFANAATYKFSANGWAQVRRQPAKLVEPLVNADDRKRYLRVRYTDMFMGPDAEAASETVFGQQFTSPSINNPYYNNIAPDRRHVVPELAALGEGFAFFDLSKAIKPFVLMIVKGVDFVALDKPEDWNVFNKKEFIYGIDSIDNAGYALWELAFGSTGTTAAL